VASPEYFLDFSTALESQLQAQFISAICSELRRAGSEVTSETRKYFFKLSVLLSLALHLKIDFCHIEHEKPKFNLINLHLNTRNLP
jgi:hypothetical protein